jgi:hypothetical protein
MEELRSRMLSLTPSLNADTLARLNRDHPELAERVEAGELSANAAAIQAGFRKKPTWRCKVDEVKQNHDKALAMEVYAKRARDGELIGFSADLRQRSTRHLGEVMAEAPRPCGRGCLSTPWSASAGPLSWRVRWRPAS